MPSVREHIRTALLGRTHNFYHGIMLGLALYVVIKVRKL
jgi:hypothetical protein